MTKCEICGRESNIRSTGTVVSGGLMSGRSSRGSGNFCMNCMSNIMQDRNYPVLYQAAVEQEKQKRKPRKVSLILFGHYDIVKIGNKINYLPVTFAQNFLKKFGKKDQVIIALLTDSYDEYCGDFKDSLHSQMKKVCKKARIDYYMLNFLSHKLRSPESITTYYAKILSDFVHLIGPKDEVNLLITEGLPFSMEFIQIWYNNIVPTKSAQVKDIIYGRIENGQSVLLEFEVGADFGKELLAKSSKDIDAGIVESFHHYLQHYLHIDPNS